MAVFTTFMELLHIEDTSHVRLQETGWAMAQEVPHLQNPLATKDLTLVTEQRKELECDLCDFKSSCEAGLNRHIGQKHKNIPQLDGVTDSIIVSDRVNDGNTTVNSTEFSCELCDFKSDRKMTLSLKV